MEAEAVLTMLVEQEDLVVVEKAVIIPHLLEMEKTHQIIQVLVAEVEEQILRGHSHMVQD